MVQPRIIRVGIVGGGFGALMAYTVLRFRGLQRDEIAIFSPDASPEQSWERFARAINMPCLRSESTGHFYPTDSPGLATLEAIRHTSLWPIFQAWFDRFHPAIDSFIHHTKNIARQVGFSASLVPATIGRIERGEGRLALYDIQEHLLAYAQHVIVAIGHGQLRVPESVAQFRTDHPADSRVSFAYEEKDYRPNTVLVIGDGITAASEWVNILKVGGSVAAISRHGFAFGQPLQVPRKYFSERGLAPYRRQARAAQRRELAAATRGTVPAYGHWMKLFRKAEKDGRLGFTQGVATNIRSLEDGRLECDIELVRGGKETVTVNHVISATGFQPATTHPLMQQLINEYQLKTDHGILETDDDGCIPELSRPHSILSVIGPAAAWAVPCADSLGGMKITARRLANLIMGKESLSPFQLARQTKRWFKLVTGKDLV